MLLSIEKSGFFLFSSFYPYNSEYYLKNIEFIDQKNQFAI